MEAVSELYMNEAVRKHLNGPLRRPASEWWTGHQDRASSVERQFVIAKADTDDFVGVCGFFEPNARRNGWEIWLSLRPEFWGSGIGPEVATALMGVAFNALGAERVVGIVDPANTKSLSMIKKLGYRFEGEYPGSDWQRGHHVYAVERPNVDV